MTPGSRRSAGTRAILREIPVPVLGPLSPLSHLKATARIRAKVKAPAPLAAQVEDPTAPSQGAQYPPSSNPALVEPDEQRVASEGASNISPSGRGRSHTTSSVLTTASSSSSIPTITVSETRNHSSAPEASEGVEAEFAEELGARLSFGPSTGGELRASASSVSLSGSARTTQHLTPTSAPVTSASSSGVDSHRDPRLITVSSHVPRVGHSHAAVAAIPA
jgi:hypothetical protein